MRNTDAARRVLHSWAVETSDAEGAVVSSALREEATRAAGSEVPPEGTGDTLTGPELAFLDARAAHLEKKSEVRTPHAAGHAWMGWLVVGASFAIGLCANALGDEKVINVLAFPLLGLVAWNLIIYVMVIVSALGGRDGGGAVAALVGSATRWLTGRHAEAGSAARLFHGKWIELTSEWRVARGRALLHACAAVMVAGVVAGMYWKGLAVEYRAGWESTFIADAKPVRGFFEVVFKPASLVTGMATPTLEEVEAARHGEGDAAKWIHLYAATVALFVWLPRLLLAGFAWRKAGRLSAALPLRAVAPAYFRRILRSRSGAKALASVIPHRLHPDSALRERVREALHDLWGGALVVEFLDPVDYGGEEEFVASLESKPSPDHAVLLMNFASTPEDESQGLLCVGVRDLLSQTDVESDLLVLLDGKDYARRLDGMPEKDRRMDERRRAWERLLETKGLRCAMLGDAEAAEAAVVS